MFGSDNLTTFLETVGIFIVLVSVMFLAYIATKFIGQKASKRFQGKHMQLIETLSLGFDRRLLLVKAGGKYVLLSSTAKRLEFLTEIPVEELSMQSESPENENQAFDFSAIFKKYLGQEKTKPKSETIQQDRGNNSSSGNQLKRLRDLMDQEMHKRKTGG